MLELLRARFFETIIITSSNFHLLIIFLYSQEYKIPFFAALNFFSIYGIIFTLILTLIFVITLIFVVSPIINLQKDALRKISYIKIKKSNANTLKQLQINTKFYLTTNGVGIIISVAITLIITHIISENAQNSIQHAGIILLSLLSGATYIYTKETMNEFKRIRKIKLNIIINILTRSMIIPICYLSLFLICNSIISNEKYKGLIIETLRIMPIASSAIFSAFLMISVSFHSSMKTKDAVFAAFFFLFFIAISNPQITTTAMRNSLQKLNSGGGIPIEITTPDGKTKILAAELITDKGIYSIENNTEVLFFDTKTYRSIRYINSSGAK